MPPPPFAPLEELDPLLTAFNRGRAAGRDAAGFRVPGSGSAGLHALTPLPAGAGSAPLEPLQPLPQAQPDDEGWLTAGLDVLDRPANLVRSIAAGEPGKGLRGLVPFGEKLGVYDHRADRVSGQDIIHNLTGAEKSDSLLSPMGAAGLATEIALDPLSYLGIGAATKAGRAAGIVAGHLDEGARAVSAFERLAAGATKEGVTLAEAGIKAPAHPLLGELFDAAGKAVPEPELVGRLAAHENHAGQAAREVIANADRQGLSLTDELARPIKDAGPAVAAGQRATLSIGGELDPLGLARMGGKYNPINYLPKVPLLTAPLEAPERVLYEGPEALQAMQNAWRGAGKLPGIKQLGELLAHEPAVPGGAAIADEQRAARNAVETGIEGRKAQAGGIQQAMRKAEDLLGEKLTVETPGPLDPLPPWPKKTAAELQQERAGNELRRKGLAIDPTTDEVLPLTPQTEIYARDVDVPGVRGQAAAHLAELPSMHGPIFDTKGGPPASVVDKPIVPPLFRTEGISPAERLGAVGAEETARNAAEEQVRAQRAALLAERAAQRQAAEAAGKLQRDSAGRAAEAQRAANAALDGASGREGYLALEDGTKEPVRYEVRELGTLVPSHDAPRQFAPNTAYPLKNTRHYAVDNEEGAKVLDYAQRFDPGRHISDVVSPIDGPPVVTRGGVVLGGNGRAMTLQLVAQRNGPAWQSYRQQLTERAAQFGIDPAKVAGMERPVLVRALDVDPLSAKAQKLVPLLNVSPAQAQSGLRLGAAMAELVPDSVIDSMRAEPEAKLGDILRRPEAKDLRLAIQKALPASEASRFFTNTGLLTDEGAVFTRDMLLAKAVPVDVLENAAPKLRDTLEASLPQLLELKRSHPDLLRAFNEALAFHVGPLDNGAVKLSDYLKQGTLAFSDKAALSAEARPMVEWLERVKGKGAVMRSNLAEYLRGADDARGMFAGESLEQVAGRTLTGEVKGAALKPTLAEAGGLEPLRPIEALPVPMQPLPPAKLATAREALAAGEAKAGLESMQPLTAKPMVADGRRVKVLAEQLSPATGREAVAAGLVKQFKLAPDEAQAVAQVIDARASAWAKSIGKKPEEWYATRLAGIASSSEPSKARGLALQLKDGRQLLQAFSTADVETAIHEFGHVLRTDLHPAEASAVEAWAGVKNGAWTKAQEEKFAQAFTRYVLDNDAPPPAVRGAFEKLKAWMLSIYEDAKKWVGGKAPGAAARRVAPIEINAGVRDTFDKLLGKEPGLEELGRPLQRKEARLYQEAEGAGLRRANEYDTPEFKALAGREQQLKARLSELDLSTAAGRAAREGLQAELEANAKAMKASIERAKFRQGQETVSKSRRAVDQYLGQTGKRTGSRAAEAAGLLGADVSPETQRLVSEVIERNADAAPELLKVAQDLRGKYETLHAAEVAKGIPTPKLDAEGLGYTTHVLTPSGKEVMKKIGKSDALQARLFAVAAAARDAKGMKLDEAQLAPLIEQRIKAQMGAPRSPLGRVTDLQAKLLHKDGRFAAEAELAGLAEPVRQYLKDKALLAEFRKYSSKISAAHESQIPRMDVFRGLSVAELNDVFKKVFAGAAVKPVFHENPAVQFFARAARHEKAIGAVEFYEATGQRLVKEGLGTPGGKPLAFPDAKGIEPVKLPDGSTGYGAGVWNPQTKQFEPGNGIAFQDPKTAQTVAGAYKRMTEPEEVGPVLAWYDRTTRTFKSWLTRGFPAFHVRNHISNRIQSWFGGVPVEGEHYELANRLAAGKDFETVIDGKTFTADQLRREVRAHGVVRGGFFDDLLEEALQHGEKPSLNPLKADNVYVQKMEHLSAPLAGGPGQLAAGGKLSDIDGQMVESVDRLGHYLWKRMHGDAPAAAARDVNTYLFDYSKQNMGDFEKNVANRAVFFYGYARNVIPMLAETLVQRLGRVTALGKAGLQPGRPEFTPPFARGGLAVPLGKDAEGNSQEAYSLGTPLEAAFEPLDRNPLTMLNPIARVPLETLSGQDFFLQKPIDEARKAPHWMEGLPGVTEIPTKTGSRFQADPWALYALRNSPLSRVSNTASRAVDTRKGAVPIAANLLTGSHIISIDDEEEAARAQKAAIRKRLEQLVHEGRASSPTIFTGNKANGPDAEVQGLLKALRGS